MQKILCFFIGAFFALSVYGQADTEVFLFDLDMKNGLPLLSNPRNVSNNIGYDNQPSFLHDDTILFSSTRAGQTDIRKIDIEEGSISSWITDTPTGSEYSPLKIPGRETISAIRLDLDGLQRLYEYDLKTGSSTALLDLKVGYHVWYNDHIIVSSVLTDGRMDLVVSNLKDGSNHTYQKNVGRSLHKIPNSDLVSYISKANDSWQIMSLNPVSGATKVITNTFNKAEDMCWLKDGTILMGAGKTIVRFDPKTDVQWQRLMYFPQEEINNITRIATNGSSNRLAFVADVSPRHIVQKQLNAYNARDIDGFMDTYSDNVKLYNFPNELFLEGKEKMRQRYARFFENTPDLHCEIKNRIVTGNKVIDEEYITANGTNFGAVAIYEVIDGKIAKVTFLR
ncbi:nuclear transport factor 2 family protein [Allomuricauda sp. SCSIO 65647]|uniref:nuclear transport factor 2 family protein n=1 Tax=Allomuricauda sp. SCSIO 65647 TaxID=2908843 RepID=UPI001F3D1D86|nr:nuclear transport factor 2 family protein [Muricauda sp. SCSIO 65647]UJH67733.1 nuclear transport factor 2 family protein [Muricauda sp. SCSIO 65647]